MTSRTKRRLAVLPLALGPIAAAPYVFRTAVDSRLRLVMGNYAGLMLRTNPFSSDERVLHVATRAFQARYISDPTGSMLLLDGPRGRWRFSLPLDLITLRVACAVALAGVWGLVVCGRLLARRWTRNKPDVGI